MISALKYDLKRLFDVYLQMQCSFFIPFALRSARIRRLVSDSNPNIGIPLAVLYIGPQTPFHHLYVRTNNPADMNPCTYHSQRWYALIRFEARCTQDSDGLLG